MLQSSNKRMSPVWLMFVLLAMFCTPHSLPGTGDIRAEDGTNAVENANKPAGETVQEQSALMWIIHTSGWIG